MLLEDIKKSVEMCDSSWHLVSEVDKDKLAELRITKLAASYVINILDHYKHDLETAQKNLVELLGTDKIISKYYDTE